MIVIGRPIADSTLNGLEYLMESADNQTVKEFNTLEEAKDFMRGVVEGDDISDEDLEANFFFVDTKDLVKKEDTPESPEGQE